MIFVAYFRVLIIIIFLNYTSLPSWSNCWALTLKPNKFQNRPIIEVKNKKVDKCNKHFVCHQTESDEYLHLETAWSILICVIETMFSRRIVHWLDCSATALLCSEIFFYRNWLWTNRAWQQMKLVFVRPFIIYSQAWKMNLWHDFALILKRLIGCYN